MLQANKTELNRDVICHYRHDLSFILSVSHATIGIIFVLLLVAFIFNLSCVQQKTTWEKFFSSVRLVERPAAYDHAITKRI